MQLSRISKALKKSFVDILSPSLFAFVLKVTLISLLLSTGLIWLLKDIAKSFMLTYLSWIPLGWLQNVGIGIGMVSMGYMLLIITISILTSVMAEPFIVKLAKKRYPQMSLISKTDTKRSLFISVRSALFFAILFLFSFPLIFVPFLGMLWMLFLWSILLKKPTIYDIGTLFLQEKQKRELNSKELTLLMMAASIFNYIPFLNLFSAIFSQIATLHYIALLKEEG